MAFDIRLWKDKVKADLRDWHVRWLILRNSGTTKLYPFLAATALLPVAGALQTDPAGAWMALGGVLSGVGGNLAANILQNWKDEATAARQLDAALSQDSALRDQVDAILQKLDVITEAQAALPESEQSWYRDTLKLELERLGNLQAYGSIFAIGNNVTNTGSGSILEAGAVQVEGSVGRDVITGTQISINALAPEVLSLFARQFGFDPNASDAEALQMYFKHVIFERYSLLSFQFVEPKTGKVYTEANIEDVFVGLRITNPKATNRTGQSKQRSEIFGQPQEGEEPEDALITLPNLLQQYPCFLLRGKPGSGKTTLLRHIALTFARGEQVEKLAWTGPVPLPLLIPLRNFGAYLQRKNHEGTYLGPQPRALLEYLEEFLRGPGVRFSPEFLPRRLEQGQCFLLLDALDEVSGMLDNGGDLRAAVARQVAAFIRHYQPYGNRFALTSRPRAYQDNGPLRRALPQPTRCDVLDLDRQGYERLITNLMTVLTRDPHTSASEKQPT